MMDKFDHWLNSVAEYCRCYCRDFAGVNYTAAAAALVDSALSSTVASSVGSSSSSAASFESVDYHLHFHY